MSDDELLWSMKVPRMGMVGRTLRLKYAVSY